MKKISRRKFFIGCLIIFTGAALALFLFMASRVVSVSCDFDEPSYPGAIANLSAYSENVVSEIIRKSGTETCGFECASALDFSWGTHDVINMRIGTYHNTGGTFTLSELSNRPVYAINMSNRVKGLGTDKPELMVVLPEVYEGVCNVFLRSVIGMNPEKIRIPRVGEAPHVFNHEGAESLLPSRQVVSLPFIKAERQDKEKPQGCVQHEGKYYYYQVLRAY